VKHDADMVDRAAQHLADSGRGEIVDLPQLENLPILDRESSETISQGDGRFGGGDESVCRNRRLSPRPVGVKGCFECLVERVRQLFSRMRTPMLFRLSIENPEQPGAHFGPSFEPLNRFEKGHEDILRQILRVSRRKAQPASRSVQSPTVLVHDLTERGRVAGAQCLDGYVF
jgi:hypothetical protein